MPRPADSVKFSFPARRIIVSGVISRDAHSVFERIFDNNIFGAAVVVSIMRARLPRVVAGDEAAVHSGNGHSDTRATSGRTSSKGRTAPRWLMRSCLSPKKTELLAMCTYGRWPLAGLKKHAANLMAGQLRHRLPHHPLAPDNDTRRSPSNFTLHPFANHLLHSLR